jgi:tRNA dimethylallyltransferase
LLEFLEPDEQFSVADYVKLAREKIDEICARGKLPIVVGGTGLYISALMDNTKFTEIRTDENLRKELEAEFDRLGGEKMLELLSEFDSESAQRLKAADKRRIVRCFEIYKLTGQSLTEQNALSHLEKADFEALCIGVNYSDREKLYERINKRVDIMIRNGLLQEARETFENQKGKGGFQAIGHKELYGFFKEECSLEEATENLKRQTRRYAKRQLTWFRRDPRINWIYADGGLDVIGKATELTEKFL